MVTARYCSHRSYNLYNYSMESALLLPHSEYEGNWGTERLTQLGSRKSRHLARVCMPKSSSSFESNTYEILTLCQALCYAHYLHHLICEREGCLSCSFPNGQTEVLLVQGHIQSKSLIGLGWPGGSKGPSLEGPATALPPYPHAISPSA